MINLEFINKLKLAGLNSRNAAILLLVQEHVIDRYKKGQSKVPVDKMALLNKFINS